MEVSVNQRSLLGFLDHDLLDLLVIQDQAILLELLDEFFKTCIDFECVEFADVALYSISHDVFFDDPYVVVVLASSKRVERVYKLFLLGAFDRYEVMRSLKEVVFFVNVLLDRQHYIDSLELERKSLLANNQGLNCQLNKELQRLEKLMSESLTVCDVYTRKWGVRELSHEVYNGLGLLHFDLNTLQDLFNCVSVDWCMVAHFETFYSTEPGYFSERLKNIEDLRDLDLERLMLDWSSYPLILVYLRPVIKLVKARNSIGDILLSAQRVFEYVEGLIQSPEFTSRGKERLDIVSETKIAASLFTRQFELKGIRFDCVGSLKTYILDLDKVQFYQIILNLIKNAVEAVSDSEEKWIKVSFRKNGQACLMYLDDSGRGVSSRDFLNQDYRGVGVMMVQALVKQLGGEVEWFRRNVGTRVRIVF